MNPNDPKGAAGALKTPLGLIPSYAMEQTAWVHKLGSDKYGPYNWRKTGVCASTYVNAILRHLNAWRDGETLDPESGISHLAHVACSCNILLDADHCGTLQDDRNLTPKNTNSQLHETNKQDQGCDRHDTEYHNRGHDAVDYYYLKPNDIIQEGDQFYAESIDHWFFTNIGHMSLHNTEACKYRRKVEPVEIPAEEPEQPVETEYRFLKAGERIQEGDQYYGGASNWCNTNHHLHEEYTAPYSNVYRRKVEAVEIPAEEPEQPVETEYRFLKVGEIIEEGDQYWCGGDWCVAYYNEYGPSKAVVKNFYRRKDERIQECTCGRIKINHHTLGWICEDCEWHGEPY